MGNKDLRRTPTNLAPECWYYEEPAGIEVIVEFRDGKGDHIKTNSYTISWRRLRAALMRKDLKAQEEQ